MVNLHHRQSTTRSLGWLLLFAVAGAAYAWFVMRPLSQATAELRQTTAQKQHFVQMTHTATAALEQLQQEKQELEAFLASRKRQATERAADLAGRLPQIVHDSNLRLNRFNPQPVTPRQYLRELPLSLSTEGQFLEVCRLLYALERLPQPVWLTSLDVQRSRAKGREEGASSGQTVQCEMDLTIFGDIFDSSD